MNTQDVKEVVEKARKAQVKWAQTTFTERKQFLLLLNDFILENQADLAKISSRDSGFILSFFKEILKEKKKKKKKQT